MSVKLQKLLWVGATFLGLVLGIFLVPVHSYGATKDTVCIQKIEKAVLASTTKKIQYRAGKISSKKSQLWKKSKTLSLSAAKLKITKKGWYTFRVTTTKGQYKIFNAKLNKKTYAITVNTVVSQKAGYYYLVPKSNTAQAVEVQNASLSAGGNVSVWLRGSAACRVWKLESAGGKRFRLKNVNSGLYLGSAGFEKRTYGEAQNLFSMVQKAYQAKDTDLMYKSLSAGGNYVYIKNEKTKQFLHTEGNNVVSCSRKNNKAWKYKLVPAVMPASKAVADSSTTYPTSLLYGSAFSLKGKVTSCYTMRSLTAEVDNSEGKAVLQVTVKPDSCTYDLSGIDAAITFGKLTAGNYRYRITAKDVQGKTLTVLNRSFVVYIPSGAVAKTLFYNSALIDRIGHQSTGTELEKKACASYALAYCNAILKGTTPSPHSYWSGTANVDCVWSKGGYVTSSYGSEQAVLQAAYGQIVAGRPCILHVTGNTSQHWVTIVGYKNVTSSGSLTAANFTAIDPWDGTVITVSNKYRVKSTYRLAYFNS